MNMRRKKEEEPKLMRRTEREGEGMLVRQTDMPARVGDDGGWRKGKGERRWQGK